MGVAGSLYKDQKKQNWPCNYTSLQQHETTVVPYIHAVVHHLKKVRNKVGVRVIMSAPEILSQTSHESCPVFKGKKGCRIKHHNDYVDCAQSIAYRVPLSGGCTYVRQTERCNNKRVKGHHNKVQKATWLVTWLSTVMSVVVCRILTIHAFYIVTGIY